MQDISNTDPRIQKMYGGDRMWSVLAITILWSIYVFTFATIVIPHADQNVVIALALAGGVVLLFNTAAIVAMLKHYSEDKENIYGLDLHYLDMMKNKG